MDLNLIVLAVLVPSFWISIHWYIRVVLAAIGIYTYHQYLEGRQFKKDHVKMDGKVVIITGGSSGLGKETALDLAKRNAKIYIASNDYAASEAVQKEIIEETGNHKIYIRYVDLADQKSIRDFAEKFCRDEEKLDVLINNAGVACRQYSLTVDRIEQHLAINHVAPFLLTHLLLPHLKKAQQGRIVNVSSVAHKYAKIIRDDLHLQKSKNKSILTLYGNSKLALILTSQHLAKELKDTSVTVNSLHPGIIVTSIWPDSQWMKIFYPIMQILVCKSLKSGAQTTIRCAVDPNLATVSGKYFKDCEIVNKMHPITKDEDLSDFIWKKSIHMAKIPTEFSYK
ncbi:hypothetical protein DMENIID0001_050600 [Sergentomyia squamirostris]